MAGLAAKDGTADGTAMETFVAYHRADRSRFEVSLTSSTEGVPSAPLVRLVRAVAGR